MGRPQRVYPQSLPKYDKLHTKLIKMYSGVAITALYIVKETEMFFMGIESWAYCCSKFKVAKKNFELKVEIPVISDEKTIKFLEQYCWKDWVSREIKDGNTDMIEAVAFLDKIFPDKKKVSFYELESLMGTYIQGTLIEYNEDGTEKPQSENDLERMDYYNYKYMGMMRNVKEEPLPAHIQTAYDEYNETIRSKTNEQDRTNAYKAYRKLHDAYIREHQSLRDVFIEIGKHTIVCPYAFTKCCVEGSTYENAGEIFMVVTPDAVYFEKKRHF